MSAAHEGKGAIFAALGANLGIAGAKFFAFIITSSSSMLAEAIHSVVDSSNQVLLLIGGKKSKKEATSAHPFGYGRAHYLYAFMVSIVLFSLGGLFALYEGIQKVIHPHPTDHAFLAIGVLIFALLLESFALKTVMKEAKSFKPKDQSWWAFIKKSKSVNHIVLILEDSAALMGLLFALTGVTLTLLTKNSIWDAIGTIAIGVLLIGVAIVLFAEVKSLLIGEGADEETLAIIKNEISKVDTVNEILDLKTLYVGPAELLISMKLTFDVEDVAHIITQSIDEIEARIRKQLPAAKLIYIEPDLLKSIEEQNANDLRIQQKLDAEAT